MTNSPRRKFLKRSALGIGAASITSSLVAKGFGPLSQEKKLGVAIIGLSWYAQDYIVPGLLAAEYCELGRFCDQ